MSRVPLVGSAGRLAAVDGQDVAGDEAGVIRSYVEDRARDLVGLADPLLRIEGGEIGLDLLAAGEAVEHTSLDRSGATALTRIPRLPTSSATDLVRPSTACLLAA